MISKKLQTSDMNPGWVGPGVPSLLYLGRRSKHIVSMIARGRIAEARNVCLATLADTWNFHCRLGNHVQCPCCGWSGKSFIATANWRDVAYQSRCPRCDSRSRHRGLNNFLYKHTYLIRNKEVLVFAPEKIVLEALKEIGGGEILTTDYNSTDVDFPGEDIQQLSFSSGQFDLIICNHVLEHVPDDVAAIAESARILKAGGLALFTIPGDFNKQETWSFSQPDQNGHFRHYGLDVVSKFARSFGMVKPIDMSTLGSSIEKIRKGDYLFVCMKGSRDLYGTP